MRWKLIVGTILVGLVVAGCDVVPESRSPLSLPADAARDRSVVGVWHLVEDETAIYLHVGERDNGLLDALMIIAASDPAEAKDDEDPVFWFRAVVHATEIDGVTYYNARRYAGMGADFTAPGEEPGYIVIRAEHRGEDGLALRFMSGERVKELAETGRIEVRVLDGEILGDKLTYRLLDVSSEDLQALVHEDPPDALFREPLEFKRLWRPEPESSGE